MALPINVTDLINRRVVEDARVEYKRNWNPEPIIHSICAFANDIDNWGGGYIIIGVDKCPVSFSTEKVTKIEKAYYIRKLSNTIRANRLEEKELFLLANNVPFDDRVNMKANIEDMRSSLISEYLYAVGSDLYQDSLKRPVIELASDMRLVGGPNELRKPLNVGLMFFNERPDDYFSYARIEVVDKPDPAGIGMTEKIFAGPLDRQLRDALSYIKNYIIKEKVTKVEGRAEAERIYNYPYAAVEEALSNAVYHKSYQIGEPITVSVTPDKMEITSLPGPDRTISDEDIVNRKLVSRRYRNRRIGDFLKELKLVEGRNTGIPTILRAMQHNGSEAPIFLTDTQRTYFTVVLPVQLVFLTKDKPADPSPQKVRKNITEIKTLILDTLEQRGALSTTTLAKEMGYTKATEAVRKAVRELLESGEIKYTEPDNPRSRNQKLRR